MLSSNIKSAAPVILNQRIGHPPGASWVLITALALTVLEGGIRKWIIGSESGLLSYLTYFSKDIVFGGILLLPRPERKGTVSRQFGDWLILGCALVLFGASISASLGHINAVGTVLSIRAMVFLPVLAWLVLDRLSTLQLRYVAHLMALLAVCNFVLSVVQNALPAGHVLNRYVVTNAEIITEHSGVRATGTFAYITGLSLMSSVGVWAGLVLFSVEAGKWMRALGALSLVAGFGCALASISRAPLVVAAVLLIGWLLLSRSTLPRLRSDLGLLAVLAGLFLVGGGAAKMRALWNGVIARQQVAGDSATERALGQLSETWQVIKTDPWGRGPGTEQIGGNYAASGLMSFTNYETQFPRIVMETGVVGLVGFLTVCAGALVTLQRARAAARSAGDKDALLATQLLLATLFYTNVVFNHTASAFAWMLFAAVLAGTSVSGTTTNSSVHVARQKTRRRFRRPGPSLGRGNDRRQAGTSATA